MKKLFALLCAAALLLSLAACASSPAAEDTAEENPVESIALPDLMADILDGVENLPDYEITELTAENFEFYAFLPYEEGYEGVTADALIGSIAHSVVLVRLPEGTDAAQAAADIEANANPNKWICVGAEATHVRQHGNTILLVMSSAETANAILQNFDACNGDETPESDLAEVGDAQETLPEDVVNDPVATPPEGEEQEDLEGNMPTLTPDEDQTDNMPAVDPGDGAVEMPTVTPDDDAQETVTVVPIEPETPAETTPEVPATPETPAETPETPAETPETPETPAETPETPAETPETPAEGGTDLASTMESILSGVADLPMYQVTDLTAETFEFYTFVPYEEGYTGVTADSMIGSIAHSVVLVQVPEGADAEAFAETMEANANPSKWICVTAESVQTAVKGNLVLLVMSAQATADAIVENFNAL